MPAPNLYVPRSGLTEVEIRAVWRVLRDVRSLSPSLVVRLGLWPDDVAGWARAERIDASQCYNLLRGHKPYSDLRDALARRLGVRRDHLDRVIDRVPHHTTHDLPPAPEQVALLIEAAQSGTLDQVVVGAVI